MVRAYKGPPTAHTRHPRAGQNQVGHYPTKWDKTGVVVATLPFHQYHVKMHGSGRLTLRNRRFLRDYVPVRLPPPPLTIAHDRRAPQDPSIGTTPAPTPLTAQAPMTSVPAQGPPANLDSTTPASHPPPQLTHPGTSSLAPSGTSMLPVPRTAGEPTAIPASQPSEWSPPAQASPPPAPPVLRRSTRVRRKPDWLF